MGRCAQSVGGLYSIVADVLMAVIVKVVDGGLAGGSSVGSAKRARSTLKSVVLSDGQSLNREGSMRAVSAWLDTCKHINADLAKAYGVDKLVWCEEVNSLLNSQ